MIVSSRINRPGFIYLRKTVKPGIYALVVVNFENEGGKRFFVTGGTAVGKLEVVNITT